MLRISKLTDYAVVLGTHLAAYPGSHTVRDLGEATRIPQPTVSKVLKMLARADIVSSTRGAHGGYHLARAPEAIAISEVIDAIEGPIAVTECASDEDAGSCEHEGRCETQANWQRINQAIQKALDGISLADMARPVGPALVSLARSAEEAARRRAEEMGP
jgi:FeS assembly SUF system regulator